MRSRLSVETGECSPAAVELAPGTTVTIGRSRENSLVVRDDLVSRLHAKVYFEEGRWLVRDFGLNGTKVAGERVNGAVELTDGTELEVGHVKLRFATGAGSGTTAVSQATPPPQASPVRGTKVVPHATRQVDAAATYRTPEADSTRLRADELTALCRYMTAAVAYSDPHELVLLTLRTVLNQTAATAVGYLGLDANETFPKVVLPDPRAVDAALSKALTDRARDLRRTVWLKEDDALGGPASAAQFTDAVCLPVAGPGGELTAALHAYRTGYAFAERDVKFLEAVAGFLVPALDSQRHRRKLEAENLRLRGTVPTADELIGDSSAMMNLRMQIGRAAPMPLNVLVQGESGAGKELVALAMHRHSPRANGPLVVVNCAAIAPSLLEGELFGYRRGAVAGADHDHAGLFEQADEGTLFLDEVADLPAECQAKLLRVIEGKTFRPVGGSREVTVDVRVIAATARDLEQEVRGGRFRQDLYFRLKVIPVRVPPLRDHAEDIPELAHFFLEKLSQQLRRTLRLTPAAERKLFAYPWPGNVRQLRAVLEGAAVMAEGEQIDADALPLGSPSEPVIATAAAADAPASLDIDDLETWAIVKAMRQTAGNVSQAARVLGISRDTLHTKLKKKNIDREQLLAAHPAPVALGDSHPSPPSA